VATLLALTLKVILLVSHRPEAIGLLSAVGSEVTRIYTNNKLVNLFSLSWNDSSMDDTAYSLAEDFIADFQKAAKSLDAFHPFVYINYANKGQDVFASYGKDNQKRLAEVQKAIDPQGVFVSSGLWTGFFKVR
jgi:hypothetical protein